MHLNHIYAKPTDRSTCDNLKISNYLGEFKSEVDKARVRFNLGIPDSYSYHWGNVKGNIEAQEDLMTILNKLSKLIDLLKNQLSELSQDVLTVTSLSLTTSNTVKDLLSSENSLQLLRNDISRLYINVAQNSTDIANISAGGDSSILNLVTQNTSEITTIKSLTQPLITGNILSRLLELEARGNTPSNLLSRIEALEAIDHTLYDTSALALQLNNLDARVAELQRAVGSNTLELLVVSNTTWNVTPLSDDIPITVTAKYSLMKDRDVTDMCDVVSSDRTIIVWNLDTKKIEISNDIQQTSQATMTFTHGGLSVIITVNVTVVQEEPESTVKLYCGYADTPELLLTTQGVDTVVGTWRENNSLDIHTGPLYGFWIITTENLSTIGEAYGNYTLSDILQPSITHDSNTYNVYMVGPVSESNLTINITKQSNG